MAGQAFTTDTPKLAPSLLSDSEFARAVELLALTPRQAEIIALLIRGARDKQIASILGIGEPTVRTHLRLLFTRFNVSDRMELVLLVFANALGDRSLHQDR